MGNPARAPAGEFLPKRGLAWVYLVLIVLFLNAIPPILNFSSGYMVHDLGQTVYHAREIVAGRVPYRDFVNHHFLLYVAPFVLVEWLIGITPLTLWSMQFLFHLLSVLFVFMTARTLSSSTRVWASAALLMSTTGWLVFFGGSSFNYQSMVMPLFCAFLFFSTFARATGSFPVTAISCSLASLLILCDQRLALFSILLPMAGGLRKYRWPCLIMLALMWLWPFLIAIFYLWSEGALGEAFRQTIIFPFFHRNAALGESWWFTSAIMLKNLHHPDLTMLFFWPALISLVFFGGLTSRLWPIFFGACLALFYACLGGRPFNNYLLYLAPFVVLILALLGDSGARECRFIRFWGIYSSVSLPIIFLVQIFLMTQAGSSSQAFRDISTVIKANTARTDHILVWGYCPQIYVLSDRMTLLRDMSLISFAGEAFHFSGGGGASMVSGAFEEFKDYLISTPPQLVIGYFEEKEEALSGGSSLGCLFGDPGRKDLEYVEFMQKIVSSRYSLIRDVKFGDLDIGVYQLAKNL